MSCSGMARFIGIWFESVAVGLYLSTTTAAGVRGATSTMACGVGVESLLALFFSMPVGWMRRLQPCRRLGGFIWYASPDELAVRQSY
jgi:hypothetical protein